MIPGIEQEDEFSDAWRLTLLLNVRLKIRAGSLISRPALITATFP
jgi:hypothetical protein